MAPHHAWGWGRVPEGGGRALGLRFPAACHAGGCSPTWVNGAHER